MEPKIKINLIKIAECINFITGLTHFTCHKSERDWDLELSSLKSDLDLESPSLKSDLDLHLPSLESDLDLDLPSLKSDLD